MQKNNTMKTRIKLRFYIPALRYVICLQKEWGLFWITISWIYPSIMEGKSCSRIKNYLWWAYNKNKNKYKNERKIGKKIMNKCKLEWEKE